MNRRLYILLMLLIVALFVTGMAVGANVHAKDIARLKRNERAACVDRKLAWDLRRDIITELNPQLRFPPTNDPEIKAFQEFANHAYQVQIDRLLAKNDGRPVCLTS